MSFIQTAPSVLRSVRVERGSIPATVKEQTTQTPQPAPTPGKQAGSRSKGSR